MKLYAPSYYEKFKCIADKCQNSCCVDWEIDIDDVSYKKYQSVGKAITDSINDFCGVRCFTLSENGRCPHLNENGLCNIIINYGEEYLTDICREHPRFYHTVGTRTEVGVGLVCEAAAELIITAENPFCIVEIGETQISAESSEYITLAVRDGIIKDFTSYVGDLESKINALERKYSLNPNIHTLDEWLSILSDLEILDVRWRELIKEKAREHAIRDAVGFERAFENLLAYFLFRHVSLAKSSINLRARIAFSILSVKIIKYIFEREERFDLETLISISRLYSSEIEYSEDNTAELIFELESGMI